MPLRLVAVSFDAHDPAGLAAFWAGLLGREIVGEASGALLPGDDTQVGLRFVAAATEKSGQNRLHLHLTSSTLEDQRHTVEAALGLGGRRLDVGRLPEEGHVVLADPGGNTFCVIGPENNFLVRCGFLGEVSCDGAREVACSRATHSGGRSCGTRTRRPPSSRRTVAPRSRGAVRPWPPRIGRNRQHFDLAAPDIAAEVEQFVALGATLLGARDGCVELADTDGNEFSVSPG